MSDCRECGGVEKENLLSLAGDLGLARSGSIEVARRPLNERPVFRLVRLRHESTAMHSGFLEIKPTLKLPRMLSGCEDFIEAGRSPSLRRSTTNPFKPTNPSTQSRILTGPSNVARTWVVGGSMLLPLPASADCKYHAARASGALSMGSSKICWQWCH